MKYLIVGLLIFLSINVTAQHWPTHQFQHDTIYENAKVKSLEWRTDSTRKFVDYEAEFDTRGRMTALTSLETTFERTYNSEGVLIEETDYWGLDAVILYDSLNRAISKVFYDGDSVIAKKITISYDPKIIRDTEYDAGQLKIRREFYFDTETTLGEYMFETHYSYGEIHYNYENAFNSNGQITRTTNLTIYEQATYQYLENGLLDTITITHSLGAAEGARRRVEQISYKYY